MNTAIVGCGAIAGVHAACAAARKGVRLAAFADIKKARAEDFARRYGGRAYASFEEMLDCEKIDVLHVCTPHYLHVPMSIQALARGIHVYQEKPAAISLAEYEELCSCAKASGAQLGLSYQNRYNPNVQKALALLAAGECGEVLGGRAFMTWNRPAEYYQNSDWRGSWEKEGGGCLINQAVHTMDLLSLLMGIPTAVSASMSNHHLPAVIEVEDTVEALITYQSRDGKKERRASFYATTGFCRDSDPMVEIVGEHLTLRLEGAALFVSGRDGVMEQMAMPKTGALPGKAYWGSGHQQSIGEFYDCILSGRPYPLGLKQTDASNRLMFALYRSARENREIRLPH